MAEDQPIDMDPVLAVLQLELARGARAINIWDCYHSSMAPREIAFSPELFARMWRYGNVDYAIENVGGAPRTKNTFNAMDASTRVAVLNNNDIPAMDRGMLLAHERYEQGGHLLFPDPRRLDISKSEAGIYMRFMVFSRTYDVAHIGEAVADFFAALPPQEQDDFRSLMGKLNGAAFDPGTHKTSFIDATTASNALVTLMRHKEAGRPHTLLTIYGAAHFAKARDLDEYLGGVSLAVIKSPGDLRSLYAQVDRTYTDLPDYAYYVNERRVVKLDNDEARREFLGFTPEEYANFQRGQPPIALASLQNGPPINPHSLPDGTHVRPGSTPPGTTGPASATVAPPSP